VKVSPGKPPRGDSSPDTPPVLTTHTDVESTGTDGTEADPRTPRSLARLEIPFTQTDHGDSIFGANTPLPAASASRARSQERNNSLLEAAAAAGAPKPDELKVRLGALNTD
jgi:hypothetical protein